MSWIDQINNGMVIITGDGREYKPLWKDPQKVIEYNISQFEFPDVSGSMVVRGTPKGRKFPMELYFVGEDHLDECERFEISASDKRYWVVTHPYYGTINCHPTSLNIDHTGGNVSKITVNVIETITEDYPKPVEAPSDRILQGGVVFSELQVISLVGKLPEPSVRDIALMTNQVTAVYNEGKKRIKLSIDAENYFNLFNEANAAILNATSDLSLALTTMQAMINAPFQFTDSVKNRIDSIVAQFSKLVTSGESVVDIFNTPSKKRVYEFNGAQLISTMAQASITGMDYNSSEDVLLVMESIADTYNEFVENLDALQTENGGEEDSYIPDAESMINLQDLVNYTISKLIEVALGSKQERTIVLEYDSNVIVLAHRFYGLEADDSTIEYLIATNNFGMEELIQVLAGRTVKYYV
jgi:hypothetical protein